MGLSHFRVELLGAGRQGLRVDGLPSGERGFVFNPPQPSRVSPARGERTVGHEQTLHENLFLNWVST